MSFRIRILLTVLYCIFYGEGHSQISDSLYNSLPDDTKPKNKTLLTAGEQYKILDGVRNFNSGRFKKELSSMTNTLEKQIATSNDIAFTVAATQHLADFYYAFYNDNHKSIAYHKKAIEIIGGNKQLLHEKAVSYISITGQYVALEENSDSALEYLQQSMLAEAASGSHDSTMSPLNYYYQSVIYGKMQLWQKAVYTGWLALNAYPTQSMWDFSYVVYANSLSASYYHLYAQYQNVERYADSSILLQRQIMAAKKAEANAWYSSCYYILGSVAYERQEYRQCIIWMDSAALPAYNVAANISDSSSPVLFKALSLVAMGHLDKASNLFALTDTASISETFKRGLYFSLYKAEKLNGRLKQALNYYETFKFYSDKLDIESQKSRFFEANQKYNVAQKETEIVKLENQGLLQKQWLNIAAAVTATTLLVLLLFYFQYKIVVGKRRKAELNVQAEVGRRHKELLLMETKMKLRQNDAIIAQRKQIAVDMHDDISSSFVTLRYFIADIKNTSRSTEAKKLLEEVETEISTIHENARRYMQQLDNSVKELQYDYTELLVKLCSDVSEKTALQVQADLDKPRLQLLLNQQQYAQLYLIIKESIANTLKHAHASLLSIRIYFNKQECLFTISDNGKGYDAAAYSEGLGVKSVQLRMRQLHGQLQVNSSKSGTILTGHFPIVA